MSDSPTTPIDPSIQAAGAAGTMAYDSDHPPELRKPVPKWAIHRRMYDWVLGFSKSRHSTAALAGISFAESSFFPIPPDVLLLPLCLGAKRKAFWFAAVCTLASVLGGLVGWLIGWGAWEATQQFWFDWVPGFTPDKFESVKGLFTTYGLWIIFAAAFTPIPYKVFTIAAGVMHMALIPFLLASLIGRGARFFLEAGLMYYFGQKIVPFIDKYFNLLTLAFLILGVGGFAVLKFLH